MKYMLVMSYDGSKFYGFQRQKSVRNVQGELENALTKIYKESIFIKGSGRTDKGVHAKYQVVHFVTTKKIYNLKKKLNNCLKDIKVKKVKIVNDNFHARHSVKSKIYVYKLGLTKDFAKNYYGIELNKLNIKNMKLSSKLFIGTHDFHNFVSGKRTNYITTIKNIKIIKIHNVVYFIFKGVGFYRYMVRNLVGALVSVGKSKSSYEDIKNMLDYPKVEKRLPTMSPNGLYLWKINY